MSSPILLYTNLHKFSLEALPGSEAVLFWGCIRERARCFILCLLPVFYVSGVSLQYKHFKWANYHSEGKSHSQLLLFASQSVILLYGLLYLPRLGWLFPTLTGKPKKWTVFIYQVSPAICGFWMRNLNFEWGVCLLFFLFPFLFLLSVVFQMFFFPLLCLLVVWKRR